LIEKIRHSVMALAIGIIVIASAIIGHKCATNGNSDVAKVVRVAVALPPTNIVDKSPTAVTTVADESQRDTVETMQRIIDSLRRVIASRGGSTKFITDTLYSPVPGAVGVDTIRIECDETNRSIALSVRPAVRLIDVVVPAQAQPTLRAFAQAGVFYDFTRIEPTLSMGSSVRISKELSLILQAEMRLLATMQMRPGASAFLRYSF